MGANGEDFGDADIASFWRFCGFGKLQGEDDVADFGDAPAWAVGDILDLYPSGLQFAQILALNVY